MQNLPLCKDLIRLPKCILKFVSNAQYAVEATSRTTAVKFMRSSFEEPSNPQCPLDAVPNAQNCLNLCPGEAEEQAGCSSSLCEAKVGFQVYRVILSTDWSKTRRMWGDRATKTIWKHFLGKINGPALKRRRHTENQDETEGCSLSLRG